MPILDKKIDKPVTNSFDSLDAHTKEAKKLIQERMLSPHNPKAIICDY